MYYKITMESTTTIEQNNVAHYFMKKKGLVRYCQNITKSCLLRPCLFARIQNFYIFFSEIFVRSNKWDSSILNFKISEILLFKKII